MSAETGSWQDHILKRGFDIAGAGLGLLLTLPLWLVIALAIRIESSGPVIYRARRLGRHGTPFDMLKFRTMVVGESGPRITRGGDPRVTKVGRLLRDWKLDELPQFLNVLRGEMSIVGPRPEDPGYISDLGVDGDAFLSVRPGLAHLALVRHEESVLSEVGDDLEAHYTADLLPKKVAVELEYVRRQSFLFDAWVLARTLASFFRGPGYALVSRRKERARSHGNDREGS